MSELTIPAPPTEAFMADVLETVGDAHDSVEAVCFEMKTLLRASEEEGEASTMTAADAWAVTQFGRSLELYAKALASYAAEVQESADRVWFAQTAVAGPTVRWGPNFERVGRRDAR